MSADCTACRGESDAERDARLLRSHEEFTNDVAMYEAAYRLGEPTVLNEDGNTYRVLWALCRCDLERMLMLKLWDSGEPARRAQEIVTGVLSTATGDLSV